MLHLFSVIIFQFWILLSKTIYFSSGRERWKGRTLAKEYWTVSPWARRTRRIAMGKMTIRVNSMTWYQPFEPGTCSERTLRNLKDQSAGLWRRAAKNRVGTARTEKIPERDIEIFSELTTSDLNVAQTILRFKQYVIERKYECCVEGNQFPSRGQWRESK